ncbi:MAG TPA: DUF2341 domain-containing protein, partial [Thermoplasmatales archaeon]|nr:DUF2341 domain-containing protein [Thermoplasmatales archaeon]
SGDQAIGCHDGSHRFYAGVKTDVFDRFYYGMGNTYKLGSDLGGISVGEWAYIALTGDGSTAHFYVNGVEKDNTSYSYIGTSTDTFHIGSRTLNGPASMFVDGVIDEVRVSYTNRSAAWISTCYNNQNDPASFVSVGHEAFNSKAPYLTDPSPVDGALFENLNPTLSIYASDLQGDQMSIIFMTNESGSWQPIGSTHNGYNDTYTQSTTVFDEYDTRYWWSVNCTDGIYWSNKTFSFTTEPDLPILSDESPPDGGYGTLNPQLSVNIVDYQGDQLTVEFWTNASGAWHLLGSYTGGNGTYTETGADMDTLGSTYYWSVNVTDAGSGEWVNRTYSFTTRLLALKWKVPTSGTVIGSLAADLTNDTGLEIVVTGDDGCVYCLNGTDGSVIWRYCTGGIGLHSPFEIADLNKDGYKEVIIAAGDALVLHGNNGTVYWRNTSVATDGHYPVVQDINGSGYPTVFFCSDDINHGWNGTGRITSMTYDGRVLNQTFAWHPCYGGLSIADCDFDGEYELFMSDRAFNYTEDGVPDGGCGRGMRCFYAQNLTPRWNISNITCSSHCIVLADANNDGVLDAIACDQSCDTDKTGGLAVINVSDGTIIHKKINMNLPSHSNPTVYDIDGDGNLEIIMCQGSPPKIWDLYDWKLDATLPVVCGEPPKLGDVTGDGSMDIIASSGNKITVYVYDNGSYTQVEEVTGLNGARAFTIVQDVDDDGLNEIIVPSSKYVYCFDTPAKAATPLYDTTSQEYGGRRTGAPEPQTPDLRAELPRDKSILQPLNPELSILAFDYQYELINISFMTNASGHWNEIQSYVDASSGKFTAIPTDMVEYETTYFWSVNATDSGTGQWVNKTFRFTTAPLAPVVSDPFPTDGSTDVPVTLSKLWFNLTDYQNDNMSYTVGTSPDIGFENRNNVSSGRYNLTVNNLQYCTLYTWYVNVTDGTHWNNVTFSFITELPTVSNPFDNGWTYQRSITINHTLVAANLTGFPLLISIDTDNNLSAHAQPDGDDILFMDGPGVATRLPHEIEVYNSSSGHLVAWVNVSNLSSTEDTVIYMYYGNVAAVNMEDPFNVWDSDFEAVWHLDETAGGVNAWKDSTGNGYDGTDENMNQTDPNTDFDALGLADGAVRFDGTDDEITTLLYPYDGKRTIAFWVKPDTLTGDTTVGCHDGANHRFYAGFRNSNAFFGVGDSASSTVPLDLFVGSWYYVVVTADGSTARYYLNGVEKDSFLYTQSGASTDGFTIGFVEGMSQYGYLDGVVDEIRVSYTNRSAGWILTSYNNQYAPNIFYTLGPEEVSQTPKISDETPMDGAIDVSLNPTLQAKICDPNADAVYWEIKTNASGTWITLNSSTLSDGNGTVSASPTNMNSYSTTYWWSVNCTDTTGSGIWINKTYSFTTRPENYPPSLRHPSPSDGEVGVGFNPVLSVTVEDGDGEILNVWFKTNASGGTWENLGSYSGGNGTYIQNTSDMDIMGKTYYWSVNVTDEASHWTNQTYCFTITASLAQLKWSTSGLGSSIVMPLAADVTGDGNIEIIRTGEDYLTVLNGTDGSIIWSDYIAGLYSHSPFELADCNKDGIPEIIVGVGHLRVIYGNNGTTYWERTDCNVDGHFPVTGDTDGDGYPEIFTVGNHAINKVSHDGKLLASNWTYYSCFGGLSLAYSTYDDEFYVLQGDRSWNYPEPGSGGEGVKCFWASNLTKKWSHPKVLCSSHCPAVADVDKDGYEDVIALQQSGGGIVVYNLSDGSVIHETYNIPDLECHSQPTIYDIDGDGNLECIACKSSPAIVWDLYAWQKDATLESCGEPPAVGDINGDGKMEIICPSGNIYNGTYDLVGTVPGGSFTAWTLLQDVDGDSSNELIVTRGGSVYCYDTPAPAPTPRARTDKQFYSQSKLRAAEYVPYGSQKPLL